MVHYEERFWHFSQEKQVYYDGNGGTIIFIGWIKFVGFKKHSSFISLVVISSSGYK